ncbi:hypothetical protein Pcinc_019398 [Petrolisthes cinctipes]|uniref:Uncharacterized protein n=1 Tax=Petrolisthes cinctipes TaxID=88211 RepID=A0AAE1FKE4_PETCI|nr:hypothetical protein Pcinc_019398 [Petrolisthes cinctipes]
MSLKSVPYISTLSPSHLTTIIHPLSSRSLLPLPPHVPQIGALHLNSPPLSPQIGALHLNSLPLSPQIGVLHLNSLPLFLPFPSTSVTLLVYIPTPLIPTQAAKRKGPPTQQY